MTTQEKKREYGRAYREKNKNTIGEKQKIYNTKNLERIRAWKKEWYRKNKEHVLVYNSKWKKDNPQKVQAHDTRRFHGIEPSVYDSLLASQNGACAICRKSSNGKRAFCIEHDHKTGRIRGLLCTQCNLALGNFGDSIDNLKRAIHYLELHQTR